LEYFSAADRYGAAGKGAYTGNDRYATSVADRYAASAADRFGVAAKGAYAGAVVRPYVGAYGNGSTGAYGSEFSASSGAETRLLSTASSAAERAQGGAQGVSQLGSMVQLQGITLASLQRETEATRRTTQGEVESVKERVVELEERVHEVEHACRESVGRCVTEMSAISEALSARRSRGVAEDQAALLGGGAYYSAGGPALLKVGASAPRPPPPRSPEKHMLPASSLLFPKGMGMPPPPPAEDVADARALLRGFARGRVVWYNNWWRDFRWYVRCNTPLVACVLSHPCSPYRKWQFSLIALAKFGFLSWLTYNGASGRPYGAWITEKVSPWSEHGQRRWPGDLDRTAQMRSINDLFTDDRTMVAIHFGIFWAGIYQLCLLYLAVPPRFLPTRPELFILGALGGVAALCVMIQEAAEDKASGGVVILLLIYAEVISQVAGLIIDLLGFQVLSSVQMQMLLSRQLSRMHTRESAGADPEHALAALSVRSRDDEDEEADDAEPLTGPDRAHPSARICSAISLFGKAFPYDLRYPRAAFLAESWKFDVPQAEALATKAAGGLAVGLTPETKPRHGPGKRLGVVDMAAAFILDHSSLGGKDGKGVAATTTTSK